jgi:pSer/pThr/pTyr-binding forkhead associated (FHA) protein
MADPRFLSTHLEFPRRGVYRERREAVIRSCGTRTSVMVRRDPALPMGAIVMMDPGEESPVGSGYLAVAGSLTHHLSLGYNTLGRQRDNDIVVADESLLVSRRHCSIVVHASGQAEIFDLASLNGTYLNGRRLTDRSPLHTNDVVRLGRDFCFNVVLYNTIGN